jgi:hypothetical protein
MNCTCTYFLYDSRHKQDLLFDCNMTILMYRKPLICSAVTFIMCSEQWHWHKSNTLGENVNRTFARLKFAKRQIKILSESTFKFMLGIKQLSYQVKSLDPCGNRSFSFRRIQFPHVQCLETNSWSFICRKYFFIYFFFPISSPSSMLRITCRY